MIRYYLIVFIINFCLANNAFSMEKGSIDVSSIMRTIITAHEEAKQKNNTPDEDRAFLEKTAKKLEQVPSHPTKEKRSKLVQALTLEAENYKQLGESKKFQEGLSQLQKQNQPKKKFCAVQ